MTSLRAPDASLSRARRAGDGARASRWYRASLGFLALFCALLHLVEIAHVVLARHVACAEHGELVDVAGGALFAASFEARLASGVDRAERRDAAADRDVDDTSASAEHHHCDVAGHQASARSLSARAGAAAIVADLARVTTAAIPESYYEARAVIASRDRFRLAPKTSPPA